MKASGKLIIYETEKVLFPFILKFYYTKENIIRIKFLHGKNHRQESAHTSKQSFFPEWFSPALAQIQSYLLGHQTSLQIPYVFSEISHPLYVEALKYLATTPYGSVISYQDFARVTHLSGPRHAGKVLSDNPLPLIIPCHRVIRKDGSLGGFTPHLSMKQYLLALEASVSDA